MLPDFDYNGNEILRDATAGIPGKNDLSSGEWLSDAFQFFSNVGKTTQDHLGNIADSAWNKTKEAAQGIVDMTGNGTRPPTSQELADGAQATLDGASDLATDTMHEFTGENVDPSQITGDAANAIGGAANNALPPDIMDAGSQAVDAVTGAGTVADQALSPVGGIEGVFEYITHNGLIGMISGNCSMTDVISTAFTSTISFALYIAIIIIIVNLFKGLLKLLLGRIADAKMVEFIETWATYPGVIYHELSHALFAFISGAKVTEIHLFPESKKQGKEDGTPNTRTLGYVSYKPRGSARKRSFQCGFSAIAPAIMGTAGVIALLYYAGTHTADFSLIGWVIWFYAVFCIALHSALSTKDLENVGRGLMGTALTLFIVFLFVPIDVNGVWSVIWHLIF